MKRKAVSPVKPIIKKKPRPELPRGKRRSARLALRGDDDGDNEEDTESVDDEEVMDVSYLISIAFLQRAHTHFDFRLLQSLPQQHR